EPRPATGPPSRQLVHRRRRPHGRQSRQRQQRVPLPSRADAVRPRLPDYLTIDLSLYELRLLGIDTTGTASGSITITRDGKVYFGLAAAVTPGADQNPNVNVGIRAGWVGSPIGPRPTNDQIDGFVNGASVSVSGGTDINGGPFGITAGIVRNAPDSGIG